MKKIKIIRSKNPVQAMHIEHMLNHFEENHDDIFDIANYIAALEKTKQAILARCKGHRYATFFSPADLDKYIEAANQDWAGEIKDIFNPIQG